MIITCMTFDTQCYNFNKATFDVLSKCKTFKHIIQMHEFHQILHFLATFQKKIPLIPLEFNYGLEVKPAHFPHFHNFTYQNSISP